MILREDECWMIVRLMPAIKEILQGRRYFYQGYENGFKTFHMDNTVEVIKCSDIEFSHVFMEIMQVF